MKADAQSLRAIATGYRVLGRIRRGPDSAVYRAVREDDGVEVALKVVLSEAYPIDEEAANLRRLPPHPHLVRVLGSGRTVHGFPFVAVAYHPDGSYAEVLARSGPVPVEEAIRVGRAIAGALDAAHGVGLLHRDVTPANILRGADGPLLTDFGIAAVPEELSGTVALDRLTPHHAAPEALLRQAQDARSDVYSLASTLWTLLAGHPPFATAGEPSPDPFEYREYALHRPVPPVPREDVPPWLQDVLRRAMAKAPDDRHPDAATFATALRDRRADMVPPASPSSASSASPVSSGAEPVIQVPAPGSAPTGQTMPTPPSPVEVSGRGSAAVPPSAVDAGGGRVPAASATPGGATPPPEVPDPASALAFDQPASVEQPAAFDPHATTPGQPTVFDPLAGALAPPPAVEVAPPVEAEPAPPARRQREAAPQVTDGWVDVMPLGARAAATPAPAVPTPASAVDAQGGYQAVAAPAEATAPGYASADPDGLIFHGDPPELDAEPDPGGRRGPSRVAVGIAAVVIGLSAVLVGSLVYGALFPGTPEAAQIGPGAPEDIRVADERVAVTLSWRDVSGGDAIVYVVGGPRGKTPSTLASAERGATSVRVNGTNPQVDYCFRLVAALSVDEVSTSGESCTARFAATPTPSS